MEQAEFYIVRSGLDWAHITIHERTGTFSAVSSFGNFGYIWSHIGERSLKEFLANLDMQYFFEKVRGPTWRRFDADETIKSLRKYLLETRREGFVSKAGARELWWAFDYLADFQHEWEFFTELTSSNQIMGFLDGDYCDVARTVPDAQCVGFWNDIWPLFLEQVRSTKVA